MPEPITICLGGIPVSLKADHSTGEYDLIGRAGDFRCSAVPESCLQIHCGWFPNLGAAQVAFETVQGWQLLHANGRNYFKIRTADQDPLLIGDFAADYRSGKIYVAQSQDTPGNFIFPLTYPMGELFTMNLLGSSPDEVQDDSENASHGMIFHAAGVIYKEQGFLFTGHSDTGKTTTARLWQEHTNALAVNDDKVIIRRDTQGYRLYGTPWPGEGGMALQASAPLKRIFILHHAPQNSITMLRPMQAAQELLNRAFYPLWDGEKMEHVLEFLAELTETIPCAEFGFLPDASAVDFVRNLP